MFDPKLDVDFRNYFHMSLSLQKIRYMTLLTATVVREPVSIGFYFFYQILKKLISFRVIHEFHLLFRTKYEY